MAFHSALQIRENHIRISAKFPQNLSARPARRREHIRICDNGNSIESTFALGNSLENRDSLGAQGQTICCIFYVAAGKDLSGFGAHRSAHAKIGIRRMRMLARSACRCNQFFIAGIGRNALLSLMADPCSCAELRRAREPQNLLSRARPFPSLPR